MTSLATPAVDWYVPLKLVLLFWLASGVWLTIPVLGRYQKRSFAWKLAIIALVLGLVTLLPASWPPAGGISGSGTVVLGGGAFAWYSLWNFFGWQKMRQARGIFVDSVASVAAGRGVGLCWILISGPWEHPFCSSFLRGPGGRVPPLWCPLPASAAVYRGSAVGQCFGFWMALNTFVWILPEPIYPILWGMACAVLEWIFPQLGK